MRGVEHEQAERHDSACAAAGGEDAGSDGHQLQACPGASSPTIRAAEHASHAGATGCHHGCSRAARSVQRRTIVFVSLHTISPSQGCTYSPASTTSADQ